MPVYKKVLISFTFLILFFVSLEITYAADFSFDYDVYYTVKISGKTEVRENIKLTNLVSNFYAQNYTVTIFSEAIDNIKAFDRGGNITPQITSGDSQTIITIPFNEKVVGINNTLPFTLIYDSRDIAQKKGRIWEIVIPGTDKTEEIRSYTVHLSVPEIFGSAAYMYPQPQSGGVWTLDELKGGGITLAYGDYQRFSFNLIYHLENISQKSEIQEITLPPDTAYQKVIVSHLSEIPENVRIDKDGNWLASYKLDSQESKKISAEGSVLLFASPRSGFETNLDSEQKSLYTSVQPFWEQTSEISHKAKELQAAKVIYDYVVSTLGYDYQRVRPGIERLGAAKALAQPNSAVCMEFSDLFVALARSAGIPAREVHGFAYTTNQRLQPLSLVTDVLHAWTEYYDFDKKQWIQVDPTWGNTTRGVDYFTKLDFNHFAFAILGEKSDYPYPAGSFKTKAETKDVYIDFDIDDTKIPEPRFRVDFNTSDSIVSGRKNDSSLIIRNIGEVLLQPQNFSIKSSLPVTYQNDLLAIPPYGYNQIPFTIDANPLFKSKTHQISVSLNGQTFNKTVTTLPVYRGYLPYLGITLLGGVALFAILHAHAKTKSSSQIH